MLLLWPLPLLLPQPSAVYSARSSAAAAALLCVRAGGAAAAGGGLPTHTGELLFELFVTCSGSQSNNYHCYICQRILVRCLAAAWTLLRCALCMSIPALVVWSQKHVLWMRTV
jgi:hypothetical protein